MRQDALAKASQARVQAAQLIAQHTIAASGGGMQVNPAVLASIPPDARAGVLEGMQQYKQMGLNPQQALGMSIRNADGLTQDQRKAALEHGYKVDEESAKASAGAGSAQHASDQMAAQKIPERLAAVRELESMLGKAPAKGEDESDVAGVGPVVSNVGKVPVVGGVLNRALVSDEGRKNQRTMAAAMLRTRKEFHLRSAPEQDADIAREAQGGTFPSAAAIREHSERSKREIAADVQNVLRGMPPAARAQFIRDNPDTGALLKDYHADAKKVE
jgi:hypothetical protein